jgi:hypothetical protein
MNANALLSSRPPRRRISSRSTDRYIVLPDARIFAAQAGEEGLAIRCIDGDAWVTQEGCGDDFVITAGDTFVTPRAGKVVVQAVGHVRIAIDAPAEPFVVRGARPAVIPANKERSADEFCFPRGGCAV